MRQIIFLFFIVFFLSACDFSQKEKKLQQKETELIRKEQELLLKESSLQVREEELANKEKLFDSTSKISVTDSLPAKHGEVAGLWNVRMNCTETTCPGSAVGDTKTEQWEMSIQSNGVMAKAVSNNKVIRFYTGSFSANMLELSAQQDSSKEAQATKIIVRLQQTKENEMSGQREIIREEDCRIVYALQLQKQE